jgi:hypothetical protein
MFYGNTKNEKLRNDLFSQIVCLKKAVSKRTFFCFNAASGTLHEDLRTLYFCRQNKFSIKALLCSTQHLYIVDSDM